MNLESKNLIGHDIFVNPTKRILENCFKLKLNILKTLSHFDKIIKIELKPATIIIHKQFRFL